MYSSKFPVHVHRIHTATLPIITHHPNRRKIINWSWIEKTMPELFYFSTSFTSPISSSDSPKHTLPPKWVLPCVDGWDKAPRQPLLRLCVPLCEGSCVISARGSSVGSGKRVSDNCSKSVVNSLSDGGCRRGQLSVWHQPRHISGEAQR